MRLIGPLSWAHDNEKRADRLQRFLAQHNIQTEVRGDRETLELWVIDEDKLPEAMRHYEAFLRAPDSPGFHSSARLPTDKIPGQATDRSRIVDVRREIFNQPRQVIVTLAFLLLSVAATLLSMSDRYFSVIRYLYYSEHVNRSFIEISQGQVWRLITPIFLHSGFLHLGFNMLWLWQLAGQIEALQGSRFLLFFLLSFASLCNTAQYLVSGPLFVGISGVTYALLGYVWMMSRYEAAGRYRMEPQTVAFMVIWLIACVVGIIPGVANTQHIVGFIGGTAFGYVFSGGLKSQMRRRRYLKSLR